MKRALILATALVALSVSHVAAGEFSPETLAAIKAAPTTGCYVTPVKLDGRHHWCMVNVRLPTGELAALALWVENGRLYSGAALVEQSDLDKLTSR